MNCTCENRELVTELPNKAFSATCGGCHGTIYGLEDEDCRQVRMPNENVTLKGYNNELICTRSDSKFHC